MPATRTEEVLRAAAACCERLVHPSVAGTEVGRRHARLIGILLAGPLPLSAGLALLLPPLVGTVTTAALIGAIFVLGWAAAAVVSVAASTSPLTIAMALGVLSLASLIAAAGGPASPVLLCILALPFEAAWLLRSRGAVLFGAAAAVAVLPLQALLASSFLSDSGGVTPWHWLAPAAYAALAAPRAIAWASERGHPATGQREPRLEELIDAFELRLGPSGEVVDASPRSALILGVTPELMLGDGLFDRINVGDRVGYLCALTELGQGRSPQRIELRLRVPGEAGEYRHFLLDMMCADAGCSTIVALLRRNCEMTELRSSLAAARQAAEDAQMDGNRILASVSHELRTPLNAITGFSDMLLCEMFGPFRDPRQKEYVDLISQSGRHLLAVVNSLLDASRLGSGTYPINPEAFRFRDAVEFSRSLLASAAAERCIEIKVELGPEIDQLVADRYAVQQIVINLLSNALKFTRAGGRVVIGGRRIGGRLNFWVSDTGIGISAEDLSLVGRPFVQIRNEHTQRFEGAGLGLSIVKGLVSLHEGTIQIASEPGIGTTVTICLPLEGPGRPVEENVDRVIALPGVSMREARDGALRRTG